MRELALNVPAEALEDALDVLVPLAPHGVIQVDHDGEVELRVRAADGLGPAREAIDELGYEVSDREVPDAWHERRLLDYRPTVIADRFVVRPNWAPPAEPGLVDIALDFREAFGNGGHATTKACLEELVARDPVGSLADLGTGSGVLAIAAARLGFGPVTAIEREPRAAEIARSNAAANNVEVEVIEADLTTAALPPAEIVVANVPLGLHPHVARGLDPRTKFVIASGVLAGDLDELADAYAGIGLIEHERRIREGWCVLTLTRAAQLDKPGESSPSGLASE